MNQELFTTSGYMKNLAKGLDPFTKEPLPNDTVLNDVSLARSFYYVADVLETLIRNGGSLSQRNSNLRAFSFTEEMKAQLPFSDSPTITEFVRRINRMAIEGGMKRLAYQRITTWLLERGYLYEMVDENKKKRRMPTKEGEEIGLQVEARFGMYSNYQVILYTPAVQSFISEHMEEILTYQKKTEAVNAEEGEEIELFDDVEAIG